MQKLRVLDLFSGIGGFSLGLERAGGFETVAFCEIEEFPRKVLGKHWPRVPIFEDVRKLRGGDVGPVDVICGGYPCQPFSTAGRRKGAEDDRHLWPEFNRLVAELRPTWVIGENVAGHISMGLDNVLSDLEGQGYACRTFVIPACSIGAPHRRDRTWTVGHASRTGRRGRQDTSRGVEVARDALAPPERIEGEYSHYRPSSNVADPDTERELQPQGRQREQWGRIGDGGENVSNTNSGGPQGPGWAKGRRDTEAERDWEIHRTIDDCQWPPEPRVGRMAHGIPNGSHRLKALGNAVVPQIPEMIGRAIMEAEAA